MPNQLPVSENLAAIESLLAQYQADPQSVDAEWRTYFEELGQGPSVPAPVDFSQGTLFRPRGVAGQVRETGNAPGTLQKQERVDALIRAYRSRGHRIAQIDPLGRSRKTHPELELSYHGLTSSDLATKFSARQIGAGQLPLGEIVSRLHNTYCRTIGVQFTHIDDAQARNWLQERMEQSENHIELSREEQREILAKLTDAEVFETFVQKKFLGAKRFSLEGGESLIPLLDVAIEQAAQEGVHDIVIGMAHRGRLNVLINTIHKSPAKLFTEFQDVDPFAKPGRGDVKYHLGYSCDHKTRSGGQVHLSLCFNPSHLGFVGSVAAGRVRAKQDRLGDTERRRVLGIVVHGDAAFAGQGGTQELLNLSQLPGYATGGTLHILVNNQVGFTTPPEMGRSSLYATDVARMLEVPIFHVNGEDPESVSQVVRLALDYRAKFCRDVIIDMYCYRKLGHNESDEPSFTQPLMYRWIAEQKTVRERYTDNLVKLGDIDHQEAEEIFARSQARLEEALERVKRGEKEQAHEDRGAWEPYVGKDKQRSDVQTGYDRARLGDLLAMVASTPEDFHAHPKLVKLGEQRLEMAQGKRPLDWGGAEALALATLADEGHPVRISGQDSGRGTFSHRHAVLHDTQDGRVYVPLQHLRDGQGRVEIIDSPLSESGVLGFDYGYSLDCPEGLIAWEAQFGDFANGAQVIIDQFIASGEVKWQRLSGLTLLLPHAFEGQGAEHSSARLERFLQLAAEENLRICYPTTPAQIFHLLRRQVLAPQRKPLIVLSPKSLLRHPEATSSLDELSGGQFACVIDETDADIKKRAERVVLCCGKLYYDLLAARREQKGSKVALVRCEQLYPHFEENLAPILAGYKKKAELVWAQEEPLNMGAWPHLAYKFGQEVCGRAWRPYGREESAAPAVGSASRHKLEQNELIKQVVNK